VFVGVADPIGSGFVSSLARPGGNITGFLLFEASITGKWLAMLREIAPGLTRAALVINPKTAIYYEFYLRAAQAAASSLGIELVLGPVENAPAGIERAFDEFARTPNGGLILPPDTNTTIHRDLLVALAARPPPTRGLLSSSVVASFAGWVRLTPEDPLEEESPPGDCCRYTALFCLTPLDWLSARTS
jgi:hypothetical protein